MSEETAKLSQEIAKFRLYPNPKVDQCALVVIDPQNDFMHEKGHYRQSGVDISHMHRTLKPTKMLMNFCREQGIPIIVSQHQFRDWKTDGGILCRVRPILQKGGLRTDTWGAEFIEELEVDPAREWILPKARLSCFYNTQMELLLRSLGRDTLIVTGCLTNQCVESTIRDAQFRDIAVLALEDCVGTIGGVMRHPITKKEIVVSAQELHEASLRAVTFGLGDVMQSDDLIEELSK
jgi:ureidoacrylate peracid hydrolase